MTSTLASFFREAPSSFRKLEEFPWLLCEGARFWLQNAQPSQYRAVWRPLRDCLVEMDLFQAMYCDQHVSDLHDYWHAMADVYDLVAEYRASLESFEVQSSSKGTNDRVVSLAHVAHLRTRIAAFFRDSARMDDAYAMYTEAVKVWRQCPGKQDRAAAAALERGELLLRWGKLDLAEEAIKEAIGDVETACGTESVPTNARAAHRQMQPKGETRLALGRGSDVADSLGGGRSEMFGRALFLAGNVMRRSKKESEASAYCARAYAVLDNALSPDTKEASPLYARCSYTLGVLQELLGKQGEAEQCYTRAVRVFARALGAHNPEHCQAQESLAAVYRAQGELAKAAACYQAILPVKEEMSALGGTLGDVTTVQALDRPLFCGQRAMLPTGLLIETHICATESAELHTCRGTWRRCLCSCPTSRRPRCISLAPSGPCQPAIRNIRAASVFPPRPDVAHQTRASCAHEAQTPTVRRGGAAGHVPQDGAPPRAAVWAYAPNPGALPRDARQHSGSPAFYPCPAHAAFSLSRPSAGVRSRNAGATGS